MKMNRVQRNETIKRLKGNGYKRVPNIPYLYLNKNGKIYSLKKDKELKPTSKNLVRIENEYLNVAKLMLWIFRKEPIRSNQQIRYIDGDKSNLRIENMEYIRKYENGLKSKVNNENLYTAIRCYFNVPQKYKTRDQYLTRMYLNEILTIRGFYIDNYKNEGIEIFKGYMQGLINSYESTAKQFSISIWNCKHIVTSLINQLSDNILSDLEAEKLHVKDFKPRPKTKTQGLRELNEYLISKELPPVRLRKKSDKELIKDFEKYNNNLKNSTL